MFSTVSDHVNLMLNRHNKELFLEFGQIGDILNNSFIPF